jgi:serine O-acetyltransferase
MGLLFNKVLQGDLYRYEGDRSRLLKVKLRYLFFVPGFTYTFFYRHASMSKKRVAKSFWMFFFYITRIITHIQIPVKTRIGSGLWILHFGRIVINPDAVIGKNFCITLDVLLEMIEAKELELQ